jgi:hypothetical protein
MNRKAAPLQGFILLAALVGLSFAPLGCSPNLVGENTAVYSMGRLHARLDRDMTAVYQASVTALEDMEVAVTENKKDVFAARVAGKTADGRNISIEIEPEGESSTLLTIRTGIIGDETESRARAVFDKIRDKLGMTE